MYRKKKKLMLTRAKIPPTHTHTQPPLKKNKETFVGYKSITVTSHHGTPQIQWTETDSPHFVLCCNQTFIHVTKLVHNYYNF